VNINRCGEFQISACQDGLCFLQLATRFLEYNGTSYIDHGVYLHTIPAGECSRRFQSFSYSDLRSVLSRHVPMLCV